MSSQPRGRGRAGRSVAAIGFALTIGTAPVVTAPWALAEIEDEVISSLIDSVSDGTAAGDDLGDPGDLAGVLGDGGLDTGVASMASAVSVDPDVAASDDWVHAALYLPVEQWLNSVIAGPFGQWLDSSVAQPFQALTGHEFTGSGVAGWLFGEPAAADVAGAAQAPDELTTASVPLDVKMLTQPVVSVSVGGGADTDVLVDTGSDGLIIPWWDFGWQDIGFPTGFDFGAFSGGLTYFYITVPTTVSFGEDTDSGLEIVTGQVPVNVVLFSWATNPTLDDLFKPPTINSFLAGTADGVLGVGPNAFGPGPSLITALPGELGQGVLIDQGNGTLSFGSADDLMPVADRVFVADGSPNTDVSVSINGGDAVPVKGLVDSGGVFGTMPQSVYDGATTSSGQLPPGTVVTVYDKTGENELYSYVTGTNDNEHLASPTVVSSGSSMNTGNWPFQVRPIYIGYGGLDGQGTTIFGQPYTGTNGN